MNLFLHALYIYTNAHVVDSSLTGGGIFITTVVLGTVMLIAKVWPYRIGSCSLAVTVIILSTDVVTD